MQNNIKSISGQVCLGENGIWGIKVQVFGLSVAVSHEPREFLFVCNFAFMCSEGQCVSSLVEQKENLI